MSKWYTEALIKGMPHWQSPPWIDERDSFDAERIIRLYKDAGIGIIVPHAKHIDGYCFYHSRFRKGNTHADYLGELISHAKKNDLKVIPYYMVVVDKWAGSEHPEWNCLDVEGRTKQGFGSIFCCINNPGYREYVLGQVEEIIQNYEVDGIWSDELNWGDDGCFCMHCRALFGKNTGLNLLNARGKPEARSFYNRCWEEFAREMYDIIKRDNTERIFVYNGGGLHSYSSSFGRYTVSNSCEAHSALFASERCRYLRSLGKPFEICFVTEKDWGGLLYNTQDEVRLIAAEIAAHDGTVMLATNITPQGKLLETGVGFAKEACNYVNTLKNYSRDTCAVYDVGIIWPGPEEPKFGLALMQNDLPYCYTNPSLDWSDLPLIYSQAWLGNSTGIFGVKDDVDDVFIDGTIPGDLNSDMADKVRSYVKNGGVFVMELPHIGSLDGYGAKFVLEDVMGVVYDGISSYEGHYIKAVDKRIAHGLPEDLPVLVPGNAVKIKASTAEIWAEVVYPLKKLDDLHKTQKYITNAPDGTKETTPAITVNKYGKGLGVCISLPLSRATMALKFGKGHPYHFWPRKFLWNILRALSIQPLLKPSTPLGVEVVINKREDGREYYVHLFNHYGLRGIPYGRESLYEPNPETVALADIKVVLNKNRVGDLKFVKTLSGVLPEVEYKSDWVEITIPRLKQHDVLILEQ